jgi:hypothetical protein
MASSPLESAIKTTPEHRRRWLLALVLVELDVEGVRGPAVRKVDGG